MKTRKRLTTAQALRKRNEAFAKLSPAQKRITVAKDVIAALNAKQLTAKTGAYIRLKTEIEDWSADFQTALLANQVECNVCAIGSVFVCAVERKNGISLGDAPIGKAGMRTYLDGIFSPAQLDLMETAFERTSEHASTDDEGGLLELDSYAVESAIAFGDAFDSPDWNGTFDADACMRAIMKNIINNKGEFKP